MGAQVGRDVSFDGRAEAFERDVYESSRGRVRLAVVWEDLTSAVPGILEGQLRVLDAGGGSGRISARIAGFGNRVVLVDISGEMLAQGRSVLRGAGVAGRVGLVCARIQDLPLRERAVFGLVVCHAVLEWVADPAGVVRALAERVGSGGLLSLMFYNRQAAVLRRMLRGEFQEAVGLTERLGPRGQGSSVPIDETEVADWLAEAGLRVVSRAGIRIFHDHIPESLRSGSRLDELIATETALRAREPFASLGHHLHLVCEAR